MTSINEVDLYDMEPNIRKAQFIVTNSRTYSLDFDHNIQMKELKLLIQVAAHLKKNNFRLFSDGNEYTQFHEETFDSLFHDQKLVVFSLEKGEGEVFDETELLLQINAPCTEHPEKFLLFYCFDCNCSICSDCFTKGAHKGHMVQDKCYYLLSSKFLVEKMFQNWSKDPYCDYNISADLTIFKKKMNEILFPQLFRLLKDIQDKCNGLIDSYNNVNLNNLGNIRDSVRDIKVSCVKTLDELKEKLHIKDIVNNQQVFKDFDKAYKDLGLKMNEKFKQNLLIFQELNQTVSSRVMDQIEIIYNAILNLLNQCLNDQNFNVINAMISQKIIGPVDQKMIIEHFSGKKTDGFIQEVAKNIQDASSRASDSKYSIKI